MLARRRRIPPPVFLAATLLTLIVAGTLALRAPLANEAAPLGWLDAVFTATSAACVTGLVVVDTGGQFSRFGEAVLLCLMQLGGIGVMTIGTIVILALGRRPPPAMRSLLRELTAYRPTLRVSTILWMVILTTGMFELIGASLLFGAFVRDHPAGEAVWLAVFHAVSAFCNAGFGLWPDSLTRYAADPLVNLTVMGLILAGNLGFVVLVELAQWVRAKRRGPTPHLSVHVKVVLWGTAVAVFAGMLPFLALEANNVLAGRPTGERLLVAAFQSVTTRTAGFNTVEIGALTNPTLLIFIGLMFVGGGPGSMAGGIKLTSAAAVFALVWQRLRNRREVLLFGRSIGEHSLERAVVLTFLAASLIGMTVVGSELAQSRIPADLTVRGEFFLITFEAVSAFGTVGLSMGMTPLLAPLSKLLIILLMFVGRLGPLALMDFFAHLPPPPPVRYATEELLIG